MYKNPIIVFEGIEGSGKTTLINYLSKYLSKKRRKFIRFREPGGTKTSEKIRKIILDNKSKLNSKSDLLLYLAARSENIEKIIKANYKKKIILIDRFTDSTIAYQHFGMGINKKLILKINKFLLGNIKPDIVFLNLINKKNLIIRLKKRKNKNKYDNFSFNFYDKVQKGFVKLAKNKKIYYIINSNDDLSYNKNLLIKKIEKLIYV
tara:strand:+ start:2810 stop:3427 length:618 start_codon:yes stop_codon:yes gene_type:complete